MRCSVDQLVKWSGGSWHGPTPREFSSVSTDTRTLQPGCLFVALRGENFDGHRFIAQAFAGGAAAAVVDTIDSLSTGMPALVVDNTRKALLDLAAGYRATLPMQTIAVTGSTGKTTVKEMTADVLATAARTARTLGNFNNDIGVPLSLFAADADHAYGVFEVGMNHPGELAPLCQALAPVCGIVTTVGPVHLEFFADERAIAVEKASVFRALPPRGIAIVSCDDPWYDVLKAEAPGLVRTISLRGEADYSAVLRRDGTLRFDVAERHTGDRIAFTAPLPGDFIVHDALLAIAAGRAFGLAWPALVRALAAFTAQPLRWQRSERNGVVFINDCYNANPVSMRAALEAFGAMQADAGKWAVLAGMRELGGTERALHDEVGRCAAAQRLAGLVVVGERGDWIAEAASAAGMPAARIHRTRDFAAAAEIVRALVPQGGAVLLKASRGEQLERIFDALAGPGAP